MLLKLLFSFLIVFFSDYSFAESGIAHHPSPYIRMHANDAVKWRVWNQLALNQARKENKLILISVGYFACHWCHVMKKESFENKKIGDFLNKHFVSIKVDRELSPALDDYLMDFMKRTRGYGGWPLNIIVTPQGYPLVGMTYKRPEKFIKFMNDLHKKWQLEGKELNRISKQAAEFIKKDNEQHVESIPAEKLVQYLIGQLRENADELMGGLGDQAKFPRPPLMLKLIDLYEINKDRWLKDHIVLTLDQIMRGGMHDVIAGGFFRYTVDPGWQTPHFEKMLYTNAGLIQVYLKAFEVFKDKKYLQVAVETTEFMIRDFQIEQGGFASSVNSQDRQNREGGGYLWNKNKLEASLSHEQLAQVKKHWTYIEIKDAEGVLPAGLALGRDWRSIKKELYEKRKSSKHDLDDKRLPGWNGYTLTALSQMVRLVGRKDFQQAGQNLYEWLREQAEAGLKRAGSEGKKYLEDYAFVAQGLYDWNQAILKKKDDYLVEALLKESITLFVSNNGWVLSDTQVLPLFADQLNLPDAQLPASDTVILGLLHKMGLSDSLSRALQPTKGQLRMDSRVLGAPIDYASQIMYRLEWEEKKRSEKEK